MKTVGLVVVALLVATFVIVYAAGRGMFGSHEGPGEIADARRSASSVAASQAAVAEAATEVGVFRPKQILFGDLHVHTTFSFDAFMLSLPVAGGEGTHPPADACDFARYCSALDFWSINDHAFSITPEHWQETVDSVRACNAAAGDPANPDLVSYLGWEWTHVGTRPANHYGHKNVVIRDLEDGAIPTRPIATVRPGGVSFPTLGLGYVALTQGGRMQDLARYFTELGDTPICADDVDTRELPDDCMEQAPTPADLYRKLDEWGLASVVIPHGTTWGFYTPPGSSWDKQLVGAMHDEDRQRLIEVYSGHGESEVYRDWRAVEIDAAGNATCPEPRPDYLPSCWQAGEIIRARCLAAGEGEPACESRAVEARANAVAAVQAGHLTGPGAEAAEVLDSGQCRDCDEPAFNYRPGGSAQYILALGNFDEDPEDPRHFRMGLMAASDNHFARPGTGYKEVHRRGFTESRRVAGAGGFTSAVLGDTDGPPEARSVPYEYDSPGFNTFEAERQASYFLTGGLTAVHSAGRDRDAIWDAMERREVYGTSGPRMLMWFDLLNPPGSRGKSVPMGGVAAMAEPPIFQVRAVGSFEQKPGCPDVVGDVLGTQDLERLCKGECYHPSDTRRPITRIEVVRIRPQQDPSEDVKELIDDPWRSFACDGDPAGCSVTFTDPEFDGSREALYYARAYEPPKPTINAGGVRCQLDGNGDCVSVDLCPAGGASDDCLSEAEPRAWSSPIWVEPGSAAAVSDAIRSEVSDGIARITIDRPEKKGAMSFAILAEFLAAVKDVGADPAARVVILTGTPGSFCAGTDLSDLARVPGKERGLRGEAGDAEVWWPLVRCPKPVIAAVDGPAVGMGAEFTSQCDVRLASTRARFAWNFSHRGLVPDTGAGSWLLPRILGHARALELLYSGRFLAAEEALAMGYVQRVVEPDELPAAAGELAHAFLAGSPLSQRLMKSLVYEGLTRSHADHMEAHAQALRTCFDSDDHAEGVASFLERRPARFTGR